jgi:hypothetical protein
MTQDKIVRTIELMIRAAVIAEFFGYRSAGNDFRVHAGMLEREYLKIANNQTVTEIERGCPA